MDMQHLQKELASKGYTYTAKKLETLRQSNNFIGELSAMLQECVSPDDGLPDDINLLYNQLSKLSSLEDTYKPLIVSDLQTILAETINPSHDLSVIFMEDDELAEAITLYRKATTGHIDAQLELGHLYRSIERDEWAFPWFEVSANNGNHEALYWLGNYYFMGNVVNQDLEKTYLCYKAAAEKGYPDAINNYADMYLRGEFVEKDEEKALELFMQAAEKGVPEAMYTLGYMYENGVGAVVDLQESREWFTRSAHAGDVFAVNRLGHEAVENGLVEEALCWYKMAAERGDSYGEFNLGLCYEYGIGTSVNMKKAKYWYQKAALRGDEQAKDRLKNL